VRVGIVSWEEAPGGDQRGRRTVEAKGGAGGTPPVPNPTKIPSTTAQSPRADRVPNGDGLGRVLAQPHHPHDHTSARGSKAMRGT
jgi:hypothetical protein